jgi:hypothetical protein
MTETVSLHDAKTRLPELVDRAAEGEEITISKNGKPLPPDIQAGFEGRDSATPSAT